MEYKSQAYRDLYVRKCRMQLVHHSRATNPWTTTELRQLRASRDLGAREVAKLLGRSVSSVKAQASRQGISLRRPGVRRGLVIGQPRSVSLRADIRCDLVSGAKLAEAVAARLRIDHDAALCPECAYRLVEVSSTGLCRRCHVTRLIAAHLAEMEKLDLQRALWTSRSALKRARREVATLAVEAL